jgi:hypothetical protein
MKGGSTMAVRLLQINLKYGVPTKDLKTAFDALANDIAVVQGLRWKIWILNEQEHEAGGIYLFDSVDSVSAYLQGPIVSGIKAHPAISEISVKQFDVVEDLTAITRGPI